MTIKKALKYSGAALIAAGLVLTANSGYFYARGIAAQILLNHAWEKSKESKKYLRAWTGAGTYPVGKIRVDSVGLSGVVLEDADKESLGFGPAHISGTAMPGEQGNIAIAGHRDSFFRQLRDTASGDIIELESMSSVQHYRITDLQVTGPDSVHWIEHTDDDVITLITCYPFDYTGPAPMRYVVRGKLIKKKQRGEALSRL